MSLHCPQCLGGYRNKYTRKLYFNTCTEAINSTHTFECHETGYRQVEYRKYKAYFPNLYIPSLAYGEPSYWKWFVCEYKQDVITWADACETEIPSQWYYITQQDARNSL